MKLTSPEFENKGNIPEKFSCQGEDINPELNIEDLPDEVKSLVLIVKDPDAPPGTWLHWLVYDIPADRAGIGEDSVPGTQGMNDFDRVEYGGPCPPSGEHRYFFRTYALDSELDLEEGASRPEIENAMEGHVIEDCELMGRYSRN